MWIAQRVLVPVDGSPESLLGLKVAVEQAEKTGAHVCALYVWKVSSSLDPELQVQDENGVLHTIRDHLRNEAADEVACWIAPYLGRLPDTLVGHLLEGEPASAICGFAEAQSVELIVLGTHGRQGLARAFKGSVAEKVMRGAPCPVLTIKLTDDAPTAEPPHAAGDAPVPYLAPHRYGSRDDIASPIHPTKDAGPIW